MDRQVDQARAKIDRIDERILALLNERARIAQQIGRRKARGGGATNGGNGFWVPSREKKIFTRLRTLNDGPLSDEVVGVIFREIISASRALESRLTVAYLGPEGTFTHAAAREQFGQSVTLAPVESIPQVFPEVEHRRADFGVVPVENSTEGAVTSTLDLLVESPLQITAEVLLDVRHCLLGRADAIADVRRVLSHPQALAQCRRWLAQHLPAARVEETASNSRAAELAAGEPGTAAIAADGGGALRPPHPRRRHPGRAGERDALPRARDDRRRDAIGRRQDLARCARCGTRSACWRSCCGRWRASASVCTRSSRGRCAGGRGSTSSSSTSAATAPSRACKRALARMTPLTTLMKILGSYPVGR